MARQEPQPASAAAVAPRPNGNGKALLSITDPQGFVIILELSTWETHIIINHPEMAKHLDLLGQALEHPQIIQRSERCSETHYYYRLTGKSIYRRDDLYLFAVVQRNDEAKKGFVKTAHLLKQIRKGGEVIWTKRD